jgi:hypothetical protein
MLGSLALRAPEHIFQVKGIGGSSSSSVLSLLLGNCSSHNNVAGTLGHTVLKTRRNKRFHIRKWTRHKERTTVLCYPVKGRCLGSLMGFI